MSASRDELAHQIAEAEARLVALDYEREETRARLAKLRHQLAALQRSAPPTESKPAGTDIPTTAAAKVTLFRSLFRGREDVFPARFVSRKSDKAGYAPACANKFRPGICNLPRIKCGECPNQAYLPVSDRALLDHLRGRHVMGVYPLLADETCWFLAADFDKASWQDDVAAFVETCRTVGVPVAVERSRSGNGAHAWFFFTAPIPASTARAMGCYLITETMARRHQLGMESYDRLFPNQDTMPRGGFGNLIALPLQYEAREQGNTVFLDHEFAPLPDQWAFLASIRRMAPAAVEAIAREATRRNQVVGVRPAEAVDNDGSAPWMQPPSGRAPSTRLAGPLPAEVRAVLVQRIFVEKSGLPPPLLDRIQRLAAFQNPEFYKKQSLRLSTALTPRVISCAEEFPEHMAIPRGCRDDLEQLLHGCGVGLVLEDQRHEGDPHQLQFQGELTSIQEQAAEALLRHDTGVFVAPPGIGKTVLGTYLIAKRARSTLILVHRQPLLDQWTAQLSMFLDIDPKEVGQIGGGKRRPNGRLDVAMIQSLVRKDSVEDLVATYGHVIVDECHHVPAVSFERVLNQIRARHILGLTATPTRRDGHHPILSMQLGPTRFSVDPKKQAARLPFEHRLVVRETSFRANGAVANASIQDMYRALSGDDARNSLILNDLIQAVKNGRRPILLTERRDHLEYFARYLQGHIRHVVVLRGGRGTRERREIADSLAALPDAEERVILATGRFVGEGFDDPRLDTLFLAMPVSWKGTLVQYAGRLHRLHAGKTEVRIFDYVDTQVPVLLRMFERRLHTYRAIGYAREDELFGNAAAAEELTFEFDAEGKPCSSG